MGEIADSFVRCQSVLVEAPKFGVRIKEHHIMSFLSQAVGTRQPCGPGANDGYFASCGRRTGKQWFTRGIEKMVGGIALEQSNLYRFVFVGIAHTGLLTQHLGGAHACAHAAQGVGFQDGVCCPADVVIGDAANETWHINACGACRLAGCVIAVITAIRFNLGLRKIQRGMGIAKIICVLCRR